MSFLQRIWYWLRGNSSAKRIANPYISSTDSGIPVSPDFRSTDHGSDIPNSLHYNDTAPAQDTSMPGFDGPMDFSSDSTDTGSVD